MRRRPQLPGPVILLVLLVLNLLGCTTQASQRSTGPAFSDLLGAWQQKGGSKLLLVEQRRVVGFEAGEQVVQGIARYSGGQMTVRNLGVLETWSFRSDQGVLRLERNGTSEDYLPLRRVPAEVQLRPFTIPPDRQLSVTPEQVRKIQRELRNRINRDQSVLKDKSQKDLQAAVLRENLRYLKALIGRVGWIDAERFGRQASADAILIVKHGGDLPLMMAVLPLAERDFRGAGDDAQMFTVLYDGVQIRLGLKQRYGTQLYNDEAGQPYVLPIEDPDHVDDRRLSLGLEPLAAYLTAASRDLFAGRPIRLPRSDE